MRESVQDALKSFGLPASEAALPSTSPHFVAAWFGIAGVDSPMLAKRISLSLSELLSVPVDRCIVANDTSLLAAPLVSAALKNPKVQTCGKSLVVLERSAQFNVWHSVAVVAGTGSIAASFKLADGIPQELARIGGWGWV